jgi:hypothetical protein
VATVSSHPETMDRQIHVDDPLWRAEITHEELVSPLMPMSTEPLPPRRLHRAKPLEVLFSFDRARLQTNPREWIHFSPSKGGFRSASTPPKRNNQRSTISPSLLPRRCPSRRTLGSTFGRDNHKVGESPGERPLTSAAQHNPRALPRVTSPSSSKSWQSGSRETTLAGIDQQGPASGGYPH